MPKKPFMHLKSKSNLHCKRGWTMLSHIIVIRPTDWYLGQCMNAAVTSVFDRVFSLHWQHCAPPHTAHVCCAASPVEGGGGFVCPAPVPPSCLNKGEDWQRERSRVPAQWLVRTGGPLSKWNSGYVTHNEDRRGLRLPQVLFRLNGEKGIWESDACCLMGWEERFL